MAATSPDARLATGPPYGTFPATTTQRSSPWKEAKRVATSAGTHSTPANRNAPIAVAATVAAIYDVGLAGPVWTTFFFLGGFPKRGAGPPLLLTGTHANLLGSLTSLTSAGWDMTWATF